MWVKMASLFWMLLTVPENSRISVDCSTMSAGRSQQSIASCEPSTLEERDGQSSDHRHGGHHRTEELLTVPGHRHSDSTLRVFPAGLKLQSPFCTLQRCVAARTGPQLKRLLCCPGLPGCSQQKGCELGWASCPISPVHVISKAWDLVELVTPLQQQHHQLVYQRPICKLKNSPCFSNTSDFQQLKKQTNQPERTRLAQKQPDLAGAEQCTEQAPGTHSALAHLLHRWLREQCEDRHCTTELFCFSG